MKNTKPSEDIERNYTGDYIHYSIAMSPYSPVLLRFSNEQLEIILDSIDWSIESYLRQSVSIIS